MEGGRDTRTKEEKKFRRKRTMSRRWTDQRSVEGTATIPDTTALKGYRRSAWCSQDTDKGGRCML